MPATLFGDQDVRDGDHDGYRMDFGMWLDCEHRWGVEADYFDVTGKPDNYDSGFTERLRQRQRRFRSCGLCLIRRPTLATGLATNSIGFPDFYVGRVTVDTSDYFQSAGIWLRRQLRASEWSTSNSDVNWTDPSARTFRLDAIGGYRFARLIDTVNERDDSLSTSIRGHATTTCTTTPISTTTGPSTTSTAPNWD